MVYNAGPPTDPIGSDSKPLEEQTPPAEHDAPLLLGTLPINMVTPRATLLALQIPTDTVLDSEGPLLIRNFPGVHLRMQKLVFESEALTVETLESAANNIKAAASILMPTSDITVAGLSCTSMSFVLGPQKVDSQLAGALPHAKTTDMARAQAKALAALGCTRVALVTPYIVEIARKNAAMLKSCGLNVVSHQTMGLTHDSMTDKVDQPTMIEWAKAVNCDEAEVVVIGCSAMRSTLPGFIDEVEAAVGKPVVTSTQAFMWDMLRTAGIDDKISGYGKLFAEC